MLLLQVMQAGISGKGIARSAARAIGPLSDIEASGFSLQERRYLMPSDPPAHVDV